MIPSTNFLVLGITHSHLIRDFPYHRRRGRIKSMNKIIQLINDIIDGISYGSQFDSAVTPTRRVIEGYPVVLADMMEYTMGDKDKSVYIIATVSEAFYHATRLYNHELFKYEKMKSHPAYDGSPSEADDLEFLDVLYNRVVKMNDNIRAVEGNNPEHFYTNENGIIVDTDGNRVCFTMEGK